MTVFTTRVGHFPVEVILAALVGLDAPHQENFNQMGKLLEFLFNKKITKASWSIYLSGAREKLIEAMEKSPSLKEVWGVVAYPQNKRDQIPEVDAPNEHKTHWLKRSLERFAQERRIEVVCN